MNNCTQALIKLGLFLCLLFTTLVEAANLTRGPYLQMGNEQAMTIRWRTDSATDSVVRYGSNPANLSQSKTVSGNRTEHEVRLTGLNPLTQYYYSVGSSTQTIAGGDNSYRFTTSPNPGTSTPTRVWLIGDSGTANSNAAAVYNAYLNYTGANNTNLWIMLGDNAYNDGTDSEYQNAVFNMYPELLRRSPVWPTLGNHDGHSADSASESGPYYDIFSLPRNAQSGGLASGTEAYYSFDYGDIHFICLDSYETSRATNGAMMTWLQNDIAATDKKWIIAFWHHPPYTKGSHNSDSEGALIDMRENALPIIESYGVDLVFSGHSHSYERSYLIDGHYGSSGTFNSSHLKDGGDGREDGNGAYQKVDQAANAGAVYTVAGASGKTSGGSLNHPAMFTSLNQLGSVILDINGNRLDAKHLRSDGVVTDHYTVIKGEDTTPPVLTATSATSVNEVVVSFSEALDTASAQNTANYSINNGVTINSATLNANQVSLATSSLAIGTNYTLTVNNVKDTNNNIIAANSQKGFTFENIQTVSFQNGVSPGSSYTGTSDSYLASGNASTNYGTSTTLLADGDDGANGELATVIKWDLSTIPAGVSVSEASIELEVFNPSAGSYVLYNANANWTESNVTWNNINPLANRGSQIGSFLPSSSGKYTVALNANGIALVESWINSNTNQGILIMTGGSADGIDMRSSEYGTANMRPRLNLTYSSGTASNIPPVADFAVGTNQLQASFTDQSSDSDGNIVSWYWDFGDNNSATSQNPVHNYTNSGTYNVNLTVTDNEGATHSRLKAVTVSSANNPVTVVFQQGLNSYTGTQDTYVASGSPLSNYGADAEILADGDDGTRDELITLIKWDISSIPTGATVTSATITMQVFNRSNSNYDLWELTTAWSEMTATWNNTQPESNRGSQIGSFSPTSTGSYSINLNANGLALIQSWINGSSNNGITIESGGTVNGLDMRSKSYSTQAQRPKLTIT
ncbi:DNRLRE domain-containing protein [Aliikangiella maris]|uniref:DNRLRE domain-containing protein n=2 Tax=Aliikangiella maris TaxID=3162458 RepID=A0ABV3MJM7_9GAMM